MKRNTHFGNLAAREFHCNCIPGLYGQVPQVINDQVTDVQWVILLIYCHSPRSSNQLSHFRPFSANLISHEGTLLPDLSPPVPTGSHICTICHPWALCLSEFYTTDSSSTAILVRGCSLEMSDDRLPTWGCKISTKIQVTKVQHKSTWKCFNILI